MASIKTATEIIYRNIDDSNASECRELINLAFKEDRNRSKYIDQSKFVKYPEERFENARKTDVIRALFLKSTNQMIGAFHLNPQTRMIDGVMRKVIIFESLSLKKEFQSIGVGIQACYELERVAREEMGGYAMESDISEFNEWEIPISIQQGCVILHRRKISPIDYPEYAGMDFEVTRVRKIFK